MKNKILVPIVSLAILFTISCKKDKDVEPIPTPSGHSIEENKATVEDAGIAFKNSISKLENLEAINYVDNFSRLVDLSDPFNNGSKGIKKSTPFQVLAYINLLADGKATQKTTINTLKATESDTLQTEFNEVKGIYNWNSQTEVWDFNQTGNNLVLNFPSTETGTSNDAQITIAYSGTDVQLPFDLEDEYSGDMPVSITMNFSVSGTTYISYQTNVTYLSVGLPSTVVNTLSIAPFTMECNASYNQETAAMTYSFKDDNTVIISYGVDVSGNISVNQIDTYIDNDDVPDNLLSGAHSYFQIFDIKLDGIVDVNGLVSDIHTIEDTEYSSDEAENNADVDLINNHLNLQLSIVSTEEVIATFEAYPTSHQNTWYNYEWNDQTQEWEEVEITETYYDIALRIVYPDGSSVNADTYFENDFQTDFSDLIDEINSFTTELNNEYDLDIEPIE